MYNDQLSTACGSLQTPLILKRLSLPFNDAEGQGRRKKPCQTPHGWALWFLEDFPDSYVRTSCNTVHRLYVFGLFSRVLFLYMVTTFVSRCYGVNIFNSVHNNHNVQEKHNLHATMARLQRRRLRSASVRRLENQGHA